MNIQHVLDDMVELARALGYVVRREKGSFKGGACVLHNQKIILLNKHVPAETLSITMARILAVHDLDGLVMKPAIRSAIKREEQTVMDNKSSA
jgi:hypothetical protein